MCQFSYFLLCYWHQDYIPCVKEVLSVPFQNHHFVFFWFTFIKYPPFSLIFNVFVKHQCVFLSVHHKIWLKKTCFFSYMMKSRTSSEVCSVKLVVGIPNMHAWNSQHFNLECHNSTGTSVTWTSYLTPDMFHPYIKHHVADTCMFGGAMPPASTIEDSSVPPRAERAPEVAVAAEQAYGRQGSAPSLGAHATAPHLRSWATAPLGNP